MSFKVQPGALDLCATGLSTLKTDTNQAKTFVLSHLEIEGVGDSGIFLTILSANREVRQAVEAMLARLSELTAGCETTLNSAATVYRKIDKAAAARIDATYPEPTGADPGLDETAGNGPSSLDSPATALVAPVSNEPIPYLAQIFLSFPDLLSPSHWLLWAVEWVCGTNPGAWLAEQFAGDWEAVQLGGKALTSVGDFTEIDAREIGEAAGRMLLSWDGAAANAAERYFSDFSIAVGEQLSPLHGIGSQYASVAFGMWATAQAAQAVLEELIDWCIVAAISAAAAAASSETIIGGILGAAATALALLEADRAWLKIIEMHGYAVDGALAVSGVIAGYLGAVNGLSAHPLPAGAYKHPGVR